MCYVRSEAKGHGRGNQIEGAVKQGQKVVVVEDLISTGGSVITAVEALREASCEVLGTVAIITYELERGYKQLDEANINAFALSDYSNLIEVALEKGLVSEAELEKLKEWRKNPEDESWMTL